MEITFANDKLEKQCTKQAVMKRAFDGRICKTLPLRMAELYSASDVQALLDGLGKWHWLQGDDVLAGSLSRNWRIIVRPDEKDGDCTAAVVELIEDYH